MGPFLFEKQQKKYLDTHLSGQIQGHPSKEIQGHPSKQINHCAQTTDYIRKD